MKRGVNLVPILCTLLILGLGANMPRLTSLVFDRQLLGEVTRREDTHVSLVLSQDRDFFQTLDLFSSEHTQINLTEGYRMTAEQVEVSAADMMHQLSAGGLVPSLPEVTPVLVTNRHLSTPSGIFWRCVWTAPDGSQELLWLDDGSGLAVAFLSRIDTATAISDKAISLDPVSLVVDFCRRSYPVDEVTLFRAGEDRDAAFTIILAREDEGQWDARKLPTYLFGDWLYFNL